MEIQRRPLGDGARLEALVAHCGCPVLGRVYAGRQVDVRELDYSTRQMLPPGQLKGIDAAVDRLQAAMAHQQRLLVVGDFDADGATSCAVALRALRAMGARDVGFLVPDRFAFGYGLTEPLVAVAARQQPGLIMTVDNGISSVAGVAAAREAGIPVLVTDHHLPGEVVPDAAAIVNPNQAGCEFASKHLAGVGVVFYLMLALRSRLRDAGWFAEHDLPEPNLAELLPLVALGTVADVASLDHNNRLLVAQGLARINAGKGQPGVNALLQAGKRTIGRITAQDLAFAAGPRLNAAGRLDDMSLGIECLLSDDAETARRLAEQLDALNVQRREIEAGMQERAADLLDALTDLPDRSGVCVYDDYWHQGVIGILASRLKDRLGRPVIAFAPGKGDGGNELKGSARSIPGLHVRDALASVDAAHPGLITRFGGHAMAAGLSLDRRAYERFVNYFDAEVARRLAVEPARQVCLTDGPLEDSQADLALCRRLERGGPWGAGFPEPLFDNLFDVQGVWLVGERHLKMSLVKADAPGGATAPGRARVWEAIFFNYEGRLPRRDERIHAAYRLRENDYRDQITVELQITHLRHL